MFLWNLRKMAKDYEITDLQFREGLAGKKVPIDPDSEYEEKEFKTAVAVYDALAGSLDKYSHNIGDHTALSQISALLNPDNADLFQSGSPQSIIQFTYSRVADAETAIAKHTERHNLAQKLDEKKLNTLVISLANPKDYRLYFRKEAPEARKAELVKAQ